MNNRLLLTLFAVSLGFASQLSAQSLPPKVAQFESGDRWGVLGDSITHGGSYHQNVELFYLTRYPARNIEVINCGISGDSTYGALKRLQWDCLAVKPTVVSIMLGMNDVSRELYLADANPDQVAQRAQKAAGYEKTMRTLTQGLLDAGVKVVLIKPSIFDDTAVLPKENAPGLGAGLAGFGRVLEGIAKEYQLSTVDFGSPMAAINAEQQKRDPSYTIVGQDRVHPGAPGHFVMSYQFLKAQGLPGIVSRITVDAASGRAGEVENCEVTEVHKVPEGVTFSALERALPFPVADGAKPALELVPFTQEFNQEILLVRSLEAGTYQLTIDGQPVRNYSAAELAAGVNLALETNTPQYQQALAVRTDLGKKWSAEGNLRTIAFIENSAFPDAPRPIDFALMGPKLDEQMAKSRGKGHEGYVAGQQKNYLELKPMESSFPGKIEEALNEARLAAQPKPHQFSLKRIGSSQDLSPAAANPPAESLAQPNTGESSRDRDLRMNWWREARFGMFIHWGAYAQLAGVWDGKNVDKGVGGGIGEWIMHNARIPVLDYAREASKFHPVQFDADAWVRLAKEAGQKYIIITSKHHDGFAMFKSNASPYNIVDHTALKRDVLKELADACQKHGIRLGIYYSQAQDWHQPGGAVFGGSWTGGDPGKGCWDDAQKGDFDAYLKRIAIPQVRELLSNYGPISVLWWDTPVGMTPERAEPFVMLLALQPGIITNNRLMDPTKPNRFSGDTETPEQTIPPTGFKDRDFEVCMTMNETWGFKKNDQNWKPAGDLIRKLVDVASKGGNFLLNVGPDSLGRIPQPSVERLQAMGRWTSANGEAIYGSSASPFAKLPWGRCTQKPGVLYLHVFDWPKDGKLLIPGLKTSIRKARLLANGMNIDVEAKEGNRLLHVPAQAPDPVASVIRVELAGALEVDNSLPRAAADGTIRLPLWMADIHNPGYGGEARLGEESGAAAIVDWSDPKTFLAWSFEAPAPGVYEIVATLTPQKPGAKIKAGIGKESSAATLTGTQDPVVMGRLSIPVAGLQELKLTPIQADWQPVVLRSLVLRPVVEASAPKNPAR